jgi:glycosyltransferase involved in cell wall biosynthesis
MASGCPVVATDVGGNSEVVLDGETGLVVPAARPDALAAAIDSLLSSPETARRMGMAGRSRALALYSRTAMLSATIEVYASRLAARSPTGG